MSPFKVFPKMPMPAFESSLFPLSTMLWLITPCSPPFDTLTFEPSP